MRVKLSLLLHTIASDSELPSDIDTMGRSLQYQYTTVTRPDKVTTRVADPDPNPENNYNNLDFRAEPPKNGKRFDPMKIQICQDCTGKKLYLFRQLSSTLLYIICYINGLHCSGRSIRRTRGCTHVLRSPRKAVVLLLF